MFNVDQNRDMCYLCRWALQRIVVQNDALKVSEIAVAYRDCRYFVTGKIEPDQWQLSQLCKPNQHRNDTSTRKHHSFHTGAGACDSDQKAGERGGFCGCWGHVELPADRSVEEESGSHYSWRPWRERERVMCMREKRFEDKRQSLEENCSTHQFSELSELAQILRQWYQLVIAGDQNFERQSAQMSGESGQLVPTAERKWESWELKLKIMPKN